MDHNDWGVRPSLFFPVLLVTVGVVWLLINNGSIPVENLYRLIPFWPMLLILGGISLILRRIWWPLSGLMWFFAASVFIWLLVASPAFLPAAPAVEIKQESFREPLDQANSATVTLDLSFNPTNVYALEDSNQLIIADISYLGEIIFETSGEMEKTVRLDQSIDIPFWTFRWDALIGQNLAPWEIGLTPEIPMELKVDVSTGRADLDLSQLQLKSLIVDGGTGNLEINLPEESDRYDFSLDVSTGNVTIIVPEKASMDMTVDGGTGNLVIDVPPGAGLQVEVRDGGVGNLRLPAGFDKVREGNDDDEGVWENDDYATTSSPLRIILDISTGNVQIR